jgi:hypothetical protein
MFKFILVLSVMSLFSGLAQAQTQNQGSQVSYQGATWNGAPAGTAYYPGTGYGMTYNSGWSVESNDQSGASGVGFVSYNTSNGSDQGFGVPVMQKSAKSKSHIEIKALSQATVEADGISITSSVAFQPDCKDKKSIIAHDIVKALQNFPRSRNASFQDYSDNCAVNVSMVMAKDADPSRIKVADLAQKLDDGLNENRRGQ